MIGGVRLVMLGFLVWVKCFFYWVAGGLVDLFYIVRFFCLGGVGRLRYVLVGGRL
jgi:hypothetical protein